MRLLVVMLLLTVAAIGCGGKQFTESDLNGTWSSVYAKNTVGTAGAPTGDIYTFSFQGTSGFMSKSGWITGPQKAEVATLSPGKRYSITHHNAQGETMTYDITVENRDKLLLEVNLGFPVNAKENLIRQ